MENLTLKQRIFSDTPKFFKKAHLFGLALIGLATLASSYSFIPAKVPVIIGAIGATLALISQFAVQDAPIIQAAIQDPASIISHLPEFVDQAQQLAKTAAPIFNQAAVGVIEVPVIDNPNVTQVKSIFPEVPERPVSALPIPKS